MSRHSFRIQDSIRYSTLTTDQATFKVLESGSELESPREAEHEQVKDERIACTVVVSGVLGRARMAVLVEGSGAGKGNSRGVGRGRQLPGFGGKFVSSSACDKKAQRVSRVHLLGVQEAVSQETSPQQLEPQLEEGVGSRQIRVYAEEKVERLEE